MFNDRVPTWYTGGVPTSSWMPSQYNAVEIKPDENAVPLDADEVGPAEKNVEGELVARACLHEVAQFLALGTRALRRI